MKVLFISSSHNTASAAWGVENLVRLLAPALGEREVQMFMCCRKAGFPEGGLVDMARHLELADLPIPRALRSRAPERRIIQFCRDNGIELVHAHGVYRPAFAAQQVKRALGLPYVVTTHGEVDPACLPHQGFLFCRRCRSILRDASEVTFVSPHMASYMRPLCGVPGKGRTIHNCIDLSWWRQARPTSQGNYCLGIGQLTAEKGHMVLVEALRRVVESGVKLNLVIAGEGPQKQVMEDRARQYGLGVCSDPRQLAGATKPTVCLPGYARGPAKRDLFANCLFFAFPSQTAGLEGQPLVLLEAMASGKAIIASDLPCSRVLISPGTNGDLVPPADSAAWAKAMMELQADGERRQLYQTQVLGQIARHDLGLVADEYVALYREALA